MRLIITIIIGLFLSLTLKAQLNPVDIKAIQRCSSNPNIYQLEILLKANENSVDTYVAEQNYRISFNPDALASPIIIDEGPELSGYIQTENDFIFYDEHHLNGTTDDVLSYNIELLGGNGTLLKTDLWVLVGVVEFNVVDIMASKHITWLGLNEFPSTIVINNLNTPKEKMQPNFYPTETAAGNPELASAFTRTWQHPCLANEGWLKLDWSNIDDEDELFISIDGGVNYTSVVSSSGQFFATNLSSGVYDIKVKLAESDCPVTLDDVNLVNLGFEVTIENGYSCAENAGFITVNWTPSPYTNALKISINDGNDYLTVNDELGTYTFNDLQSGIYSIKVQNKSGSCLTEVETLELKGNTEASPSITRSWKHTDCGQSNGSITLSWMNNPAVEEIQISMDGGNTYKTIPDAQQLYFIDDLNVGNYDIWVKWGADANACAIQLDDVSLINNAPENTAVELQYACNDQKTQLIDNVYKDVTKHQFKFRIKSNNSWNDWVLENQTQSNLIDISENIENATHVRYRFRVLCDGAWSLWSVPKTTAIPQCKLGLVNSTLPIEVVPNPFSNRFNIKISNNQFKAQKARIELTNLIGKIIYTNMVDLNEGENRFNVEPNLAISAGIYLVNIELDDGTTQTIKLLKK